MRKAFQFPALRRILDNQGQIQYPSHHLFRTSLSTSTYASYGSVDSHTLSIINTPPNNSNISGVNILVWPGSDEGALHDPVSSGGKWSKATRLGASADHIKSLSEGYSMRGTVITNMGTPISQVRRPRQIPIPDGALGSKIRSTSSFTEKVQFLFQRGCNYNSHNSLRCFFTFPS